MMFLTVRKPMMLAVTALMLTMPVSGMKSPLYSSADPAFLPGFSFLEEQEINKVLQAAGVDPNAAAQEHETAGELIESMLGKNWGQSETPETVDSITKATYVAAGVPYPASPPKEPAPVHGMVQASTSPRSRSGRTPPRRKRRSEGGKSTGPTQAKQDDFRRQLRKIKARQKHADGAGAEDRVDRSNAGANQQKPVKRATMVKTTFIGHVRNAASKLQFWKWNWFGRKQDDPKQGKKSPEPPSGNLDNLLENIGAPESEAIALAHRLAGKSLANMPDYASRTEHLMDRTAKAAEHLEQPVVANHAASTYHVQELGNFNETDEDLLEELDSQSDTEAKTQ